MRLLHVSDPHFGTEVSAAVEGVVALAQQLRPEVLVLSGDITQRARRYQFEAAHAFVQRLGIERRLVIPGNHDIPLFNLWQRAVDPYAGFRRCFGEVDGQELSTDTLLAVAVRTTRRWRHKHGQVSDQQVEAVAARLRRADEKQLRLVIVHQPMVVPHDDEANNLLRNAETAALAWADAGADLVLGGHIHWPEVRPMSSRYPHIRRELWSVQAGTAVSSRVRRRFPHSVNVVHYEPESRPALCLVERWDLPPGASHFETVATTEIRLSRG